MKKFRHILAPILLVVTLSTANAQDAPDTVATLPGIELETAVDRAESYIGDLITYTLTIRYDSTYDLIPPPLGANLGAFDVKEYDPDIETVLEDGRIQSKTIFVLSTFTVGEYIIPPMPVAFVLPDSSRKLIMAEPVPITIKSMLDMAGADTLDIRPLKAPYDFPPDYTAYYMWGGGAMVALLIGIVVILWVLWRRAKRRQEKEDLREPWEIAFEKLAFLKVEFLDKGLGEQPRAKQYYVEITEAVRSYLGRIYKLDVLEMTTEEFLDVFAEIDLPGDSYKSLSEFFKHADQVKFARMMPSIEHTENDFLTAHELVDRVRVDYQHRLEQESNLPANQRVTDPTEEVTP